MTDDTRDESASEGRPASADRTLSWLPLVGAAVLAIVVAVVVFLVGAGKDNRGGSRVDDDGALACPGTYAGSVTDITRRVPAVPSGVDGEADLVPNAQPRYVAICRYRAAPNARTGVDLPIDGRVVLDDNERGAARFLSNADKATKTAACDLPAGARDQPSYLLGFTFSTGIVWVSIPGSGCQNASNGEFVTKDDLRTVTNDAFRTKVWPAAAN